MNKTLFVLTLLICGAPLCAQAPAQKAQDAKTAAAPAASAKQGQAAPHAVTAAKTGPARPASASQAETEGAGYEGDGVVIDSKADDSGRSAAAAGAEQEEAAVPGGIPSSYGQCKGVMNEAGRTMLVFESLEDGTISFVQVSIGKNGASWKLVDRIARSAE